MSERDVAAKIARSIVAVFLRRRRAKTLAMRVYEARRLRHDVAHEADHDDREDEDREIAVERREIAEAHGCRQ